MIWKAPYKIMDKGFDTGYEVADVGGTSLIDNLKQCQQTFPVQSYLGSAMWEHTRASNPKLLSKDSMIPTQKRMLSIFPISIVDEESMPLV
jgi:hypothetical protein